MDSSELAQLMLTWEQKRKELDGIEEIIKMEVLEIRRTQTVGNVRATYSAGRKRYYYEEGASDAILTSPEVISKHTKEVIDWKSVCEDVGLTKGEIPYEQGQPSVSIKLLD